MIRPWDFPRASALAQRFLEIDLGLFIWAVLLGDSRPSGWEAKQAAGPYIVAPRTSLLDALLATFAAIERG